MVKERLNKDFLTNNSNTHEILLLNISFMLQSVPLDSAPNTFRHASAMAKRFIDAGTVHRKASCSRCFELLVAHRESKLLDSQRSKQSKVSPTESVKDIAKVMTLAPL